MKNNVTTSWSFTVLSSQGFLFAISAEGKKPATISYYEGNFRRFM